MNFIEHAEPYNASLRTLTRKISAAPGAKADVNISRMKQRLNLVLNATPLLPLQMGSPYLWKYRKQIKDLHDEETGEFDWDMLETLDLTEAQEDAGAAGDDKQLVLDFIDGIRTIILQSSEEEKVDLWNDTMTLLSHVAKYKKACKAAGLDFNNIS